MNALTQPQTVLTDEITSGADYEIVRKVIETISENYRDQPSLEDSLPPRRHGADGAAEAVHALGRAVAEGLSCRR
jgi:hypothetical protein